MKILHVIPTLDPRAGGPPIVVSHLAAAQALLGHDLHVMAYKPREEARQRILADNRQPGFDRVTQHLLPCISLRERITGSHAAAMARKIVPKMDILHIHGLWESQLARSATVAHRLRIPFVITPHGMLHPWSLAQSRWKKKFSLATGFRTILNRCAFLHLLNRDEQNLLAPLNLHCPTKVIPNGISPEEFENAPPTGTIRNLFPALGDSPYILFLGRLHEQKGVDLLLAAFGLVTQQHAAVKLLIAGPDYGRSDQIKQLSHGMTDRLLTVGPIYGNTKLAALQDAVCFCLPSRHEGFSLAVLESLACGTPVVISPECHFPEVTAAGAGLIAPLNPPQIATALLSYLNDSPARAAASIAAKKLIAEHYTWSHIAKQTIAAYAQS
jgi:glycosyltransferase involved in cell wall biosynthesis